LSDGGVHSHMEHAVAILEMARREGLTDRVFVHAFLDGRDTAPDSAVRFLEMFLDRAREIGVGRMATVQGRYYAMDRDKRWDRTEKAYRAMVYGEGPKYRDPIAAVRESYEKSVFDEFVMPTVIVDEGGQPVGLVESGDAVIFSTSGRTAPSSCRRRSRTRISAASTGARRIRRTSTSCA